VTPDEYVARSLEMPEYPWSRQTDLCVRYAVAVRDSVEPPDVPTECRCRKGCGRPHLPYGSLCGPCEDVARAAYWAAGIGEVG
jgi:hypothetical protein